MSRKYETPGYRIFTWEEFHERVRTRIYTAVGRQRPRSSFDEVYLDILFNRDPLQPEVVTSGKLVFGLIDGMFEIADVDRKITCYVKEPLAQLFHDMMKADGRLKITAPQFAHLMQFVKTIGELSDSKDWT